VRSSESNVVVPKARVVVVEDHPMVRDIVAIACSNRPTLEVVGTAGDGLQAVAVCLAVKPDVLVLDLGLPGIDGFEVIRRVRRVLPGLRILLFSGHLDRTLVLQCLRLGVDGLVEKTGSVDELGMAAETVAAGLSAYSLEHRRQAQEQLGDVLRRSRESAKAFATLTKRQRQILQLVAAGLTTRQMAARLALSDRTVETHIGNLYQRLAVRNRTQAIRRAVALHLVDPTEFERPAG
jgi:DNA-binding NarL/FixJ family response regulator